MALEKTMQQESDTMILLERELAETEKAVVENLLPPVDDRADMMNIWREMGQFSIDLDGVSVNFPVILTQSRSTFDQNAYMNSLQISQKEGSEIGRAFKWGRII